MKTNARWNSRFIPITAALLAVATVPAAAATTPQYQIYDIGVIDPGDDASQGFGVSHGGIAVGRSIRTGGSQAFTWTLNGGIIGLPNLAGRSHAVSNSANDNGDRGRDCRHHTFRHQPVTGDLAKWRGFAVAVAAGRNAG